MLSSTPNDERISPEEGQGRAPLDDSLRAELERFLAENRDIIVDAGTAWVLESAIDLREPHLRAKTRALVTQVVDIGTAGLLGGDLEQQQTFIEYVTSLRAADRFHISTLLRGFLSFKRGVERALEKSDIRPARQVQMLRAIDEYSRGVIFHMSDIYVEKLHDLASAESSPSMEMPATKAESAAASVSLEEALAHGEVERLRIGKYFVRGKLGRGGMGTVLEAFDPDLDRPVALKVLHHELDMKHVRRLRREAKALAKLSHPNVVQVYEVGEVDGRTFVAMELVEGRTLRKWIRQDPPPSWRESVGVFLQIGSGLAAAHEQGLVHRDFKPANAIIDAKGRVRVLDFGLARQIEQPTESDGESSSVSVEPGLDPALLEASLTHTGTVLGTPAYMPPEQMQGLDSDGRGDQFSFCVALYEALYGQRPFAGRSMLVLLGNVFRQDVLPAPKGQRVPRALRKVLLRGLAIDPGDRWPSMEALMAELEQVLRPRLMPWLVLVVAGAVMSWGLWDWLGG